jgi:hypothetical protein
LLGEARDVEGQDFTACCESRLADFRAEIRVVPDVGRVGFAGSGGFGGLNEGFGLGDQFVEPGRLRD